MGEVDSIKQKEERIRNCSKEEAVEPHTRDCRVMSCVKTEKFRNKKMWSVETRLTSTKGSRKRKRTRPA